MNYREILRHELNKRMQANPRYSMGAFARDLGLSRSHLSQILNYKKGISPLRGREIGKAMGLENSGLDRFCDLIASEHARSSFSKLSAEGRLKDIYLGSFSISFQQQNEGILKEKMGAYLLELESMEALKGVDPVRYRIYMKSE